MAAKTEGLLGSCGCSDGATRARASAAPASCTSTAIVSSLLLPVSSGAAAAWILAPPSPAPLPDCLAAALWGFAFSSTVSNGLGAPTLGLCRSRGGAGGGAAGRCIQGPGWMMVSHGWLSLGAAPLEPELRGQRHKIAHIQPSIHRLEVLRGFASCFGAPRETSERERGSVHIDFYKIELNMTIASWRWFPGAQEEQRVIQNFRLSSLLKT